MKTYLLSMCLVVALISCQKNNRDIITTPTVCDIQEVYAKNANKVTITNGIWGTVSSMEGNCMPIIDPSSNACKHCPVKRTIQFYPYTLHSNATMIGSSNVFFSSFNAPLIAQVDADAEGFFQINIPSGHYSIAIVENGNLYANGRDGYGGLCPVNFTGGLEKINLTMTYKAAF
ncbi:MAG: hypothetical protein KF781_09165 [Chitinophagaceae bacterium]|nr:hypothetical protein [Chitinophagaceae bacterium]MCW5905014.1 hypothetical protein [Chitinophagaceae bacterium]